MNLASPSRESEGPSLGLGLCLGWGRVEGMKAAGAQGRPPL